MEKIWSFLQTTYFVISPYGGRFSCLKRYWFSQIGDGLWRISFWKNLGTFRKGLKNEAKWFNIRRWIKYWILRKVWKLDWEEWRWIGRIIMLQVLGLLIWVRVDLQFGWDKQNEKNFGPFYLHYFWGAKKRIGKNIDIGHFYRRGEYLRRRPRIAGQFGWEHSIWEAINYINSSIMSDFILPLSQFTPIFHVISFPILSSAQAKQKKSGFRL